MRDMIILNVKIKNMKAAIFSKIILYTNVVTIYSALFSLQFKTAAVVKV